MIGRRDLRLAFLAGLLSLCAAACARTGRGALPSPSGDLVTEAVAMTVRRAGDAALSGPGLPEALARAGLDLVEDFRPGLSHGPKGPEHQRYIVLHDTEGSGSPESVIDYWDGSGDGVAAHFVIGRDGHVVQCVPLDEIAHHAGYGDAGHNELFGVTDESRDDRAGTVPIGSWAPDYGMNSYSIGIELVHIGGREDYPDAQLAALDRVIALIDAHYGFECDIIDHKAWRTGNTDTSPEFAAYLGSYQSTRTHGQQTG